MKFQDKEVELVTKPQIFNPPRDMLVWVSRESKPTIEKVCAILPYEDRASILLQNGRGYSFAMFCAEATEEMKPRRATNRELSKWLAQGNGELQIRSAVCGVSSSHGYDLTRENYQVADCFLVRKWDDTKWHEPTIDYMGIED